MGFCNPVTGELDASRFGNPMPWIGIYIAGASFLCAAAMAFDLFSGFRKGKLWFPPRLFSLNATTLTLLGVATKVTTDLSTAMPSPREQLTKLSGTVLLCTAIANSMASLGQSDDVLPSVAAAGILVVTVVVDVCVQISTGVIYVLIPEHITMVILTVVVLLSLICSALTVAGAKRRLEGKYTLQGRGTLPDETTSNGSNVYSLGRLEQFLKKRWLLAHTCSPQYGGAETCVAAGAFCLVGTSVFAEALVRALVMKDSKLEFCGGTKMSDYKWSITCVLIVQAAAVVIGTVAPAYRWFTALNFESVHIFDASGSFLDPLVEWTGRGQWVVVKKLWNNPGIRWALEFQRRRTADRMVAEMLVCLAGVVFLGVAQLSYFICLAPRLIRKMMPRTTPQDKDLELRSYALTVDSQRKMMPRTTPQEEDLELRSYALTVDSQSDFVERLLRSELRNMEKRMEMGRKKKPTALARLIKSHSTFSDGFKGLSAFHSDTVLDRTCSWALPVAIFACIASELPDTERNEVKSLLDGVSEGFRFLELVRKIGGEVIDYDFWHVIVKTWGHVVQRRLSSSTSPYNTYGKRIIEKVVRPGLDDFTLRGNERCVYAAILRKYDAGVLQTDKELFDWLRGTIADIMGACLTNLPLVMRWQCQKGGTEMRERGARDAAYLLGQVEDILKIFQEEQYDVGFSPTDPQYIKSWLKTEQRPNLEP